MATITQTTSGTWKAQIRRTGVPAISKTFKNKIDAIKWSRSVESAQDQGVFVDRSEADRTTVGELIDRYILEVTPLKRSAKNDKQMLLYLKKHFGHYVVSQLQSKHIATYRDKRLAEGRAGATVFKEIGALSHLLNISIKDWGIPLVSNVATLVRKPKQARGRDRRLEEGEEELLLNKARKSKSVLMEQIIIVAIETAMRLGELLSLEWKNIDLQQQTALLPMTKNGESRIVPLSKKAVETIKSIPRQLHSQKVFWCWAKADSFENAWKRVLSKTEIQDLRFHDFRHEGCSRLFERGFNIMEVSAISGHKTLQMLKRYTHLKPADLVAKLNKA